MSSNSSADATMYLNHSSYPFSDGCPDRQRQPPTTVSDKTSNIVKSQSFTPMDDLSLNYSYLSLSELPLIPDPQFNSVPVVTRQLQLDVPLHAPVPSAGHGPAFMDPNYFYYDSGQTPGEVLYVQHNHLYDTQDFPIGSDGYCAVNYGAQQDLSNSLWNHGQFDAGVPSMPQSTFLTPSELRLAELEAKGRAQAPVTDEKFGTEGRVESASKARRRAMAKSIGFTPTDPDIISSHEKKRHYLECLEQYVLYLHEQFELVGATPDPLEQVASYKGLNSRSIRTLLVHMENTTRKLNIRTQAEEKKYFNLSNEIIQRKDSGN